MVFFNTTIIIRALLTSLSIISNTSGEKPSKTLLLNEHILYTSLLGAGSKRFLLD